MKKGCLNFEIIIRSLFAMFFSLLSFCGFFVQKFGTIFLRKPFVLICALVATPFFYGILLLLDKVSFSFPMKREKLRTACDTRFVFVALFVLLSLVWGLVLFGIYPGLFCYDANYELHEVRWGEFDTHHPLAHVLYIGIIKLFFEIFGDWNLSIFVFLLIQLLFLAFVVSVCAYLANRRSFSLKRFLIQILFWAFFPTIWFIVCSSTKDTLFDAGILLCIVSVRAFLLMGDKWVCLLYSASVLLIVLNRNTGIYISFVWLLILLFLLLKKRGEKKYGIIVCCTVVAMLLSLLTNIALKEKTDAVSITTWRETLTVPIQQITRTYIVCPEDFTEEEKNRLFELIPEEYINKYNPRISDDVKWGFRDDVFRSNQRYYLSLYLRKGIRHFDVYWDAWLNTTFPYWYPNGEIVLYGDISAYYTVMTEQPGEMAPKIEFIYRVMKWLGNNKDAFDIPLIKFLFLPGSLSWIYLFYIYRAIQNRNVNFIITVTPLIIAMCFTMLGPVALVRYVGFLWLCFPVVSHFFCEKMDRNEDD